MSDGPACPPDRPLRHVMDLGATAVAREIFGPDHRHVAFIQEAFRDPRARRGDPPGSVLLHTSGNSVILCGRAGAEEDMARAVAVIEALILRVRHSQPVTEAEVLAALNFAAERGPKIDRAEPVVLPQMGGLTLRTPRQRHYAEALRDPQTDLIFGVGPAGTGKTFLAVAAAVEAMKQGRVERIVVTRPAVEAGERLGFLPGALEDKVDPYMAPIWDAFRALKVSDADLKNKAKIEVAPLAFMRGRTLAKSFVIVDEAQNATALQMKMVLTRLGDGSRMVVTGDPSQVDLPNHQLSGLAHALAILDGVEGVEIVRFAAADVVRHRLVTRIIQAYDLDDSRRRGVEPMG